jgi:hypothetical protein
MINTDRIEDVPDAPDIFHGITGEIAGVLKEHIPVIEDEIVKMLIEGGYSPLDICYNIASRYNISSNLVKYFYHNVSNAYNSALIEQEYMDQIIAEEEDLQEKKEQEGIFNMLLQQRNAYLNKNRQINLENEEFALNYKAPDGTSHGFTLKEPTIKQSESGEITLTFTEEDENRKVLDWMLKWQEAIKCQDETSKKK